MERILDLARTAGKSGEGEAAAESSTPEVGETADLTTDPGEDDAAPFAGEEQTGAPEEMVSGTGADAADVAYETFLAADETAATDETLPRGDGDESAVPDETLRGTDPEEIDSADGTPHAADDAPDDPDEESSAPPEFPVDDTRQPFASGTEILTGLHHDSPAGDDDLASIHQDDALAGAMDERSLADQVEERLAELMDQLSPAAPWPSPGGELTDEGEETTTEDDSLATAGGSLDQVAGDEAGESAMPALPAVPPANAAIEELLGDVLSSPEASYPWPSPETTTPAGDVDQQTASDRELPLSAEAATVPGEAESYLSREEFDLGADEVGDDADEVPVVSGRTPWRVLLVGGLLGCIAVSFWAWRTGIVRFEQWVPGGGLETVTVAELDGGPAAGDDGTATVAEDDVATATDAGAITVGDGDAAGGAVVEEAADEITATAAASDVTPVMPGDAGDGAGEVVTAAAAGAISLPLSGVPDASPASAPAAPATSSGDAGTTTADGTSTPAMALPPDGPTMAATATKIPPTVEIPADARYSVHVSSYRKLDRAERHQQRFLQAGYSVRIVHTDLGDKGVWYRVHVGYYATLDQARAAATAILADKLSDFAQAKRLKR